MALDRVKQLNALLALLDSPKEGDEILFTLQGDNTKYRGVVKKKVPSHGAVFYEVVSKTHLSLKGVIETIEFKGKVFKTGSW